MIPIVLLIMTTTNRQPEPVDSCEGRYGAMGVGGNPHGLTTPTAVRV
jgi:hypothetical protein